MQCDLALTHADIFLRSKSPDASATPFDTIKARQAVPLSQMYVRESPRSVMARRPPGLFDINRAKVWPGVDEIIGAEQDLTMR